ncbi:MAG: PTS sugar transporter subunit IIB [Enterococcus avium]
MMKKIMLVCNSGMSTAMLARKMNEQVGDQYQVFAKGEGDYLDFVAEVDVVLVGPQIRHLLPQIRTEVPDGVPVMSVKPQDYGMMNVAGIVQMLESVH